jgi:hypothetical protein
VLKLLLIIKSGCSIFFEWFDADLAWSIRCLSSLLLYGFFCLHFWISSYINIRELFIRRSWCFVLFCGYIIIHIIQLFNRIKNMWLFIHMSSNTTVVAEKGKRGRKRKVTLNPRMFQRIMSWNRKTSRRREDC